MAGFGIPNTKEYSIANPLEIVNVYFASKNPYVGVENCFIPMPAILYAYIIDEMDRTNTKNALGLIKGIAEFYFPVSGIFKAYEAKRWFDRYVPFIVLTKTIIDKSLNNKKTYTVLKDNLGEKTMEMYNSLGTLFDYAMMYRDFKNKDFLDVTSGLYFKYNELTEKQRDELEKQLPGFKNLFSKLKLN
jgi:hypothetical protein